MATQSNLSDEVSVSGNQADNLYAEIEPLLRNLWYKNCRCCGRKQVPFEQRKWVACLLCTIDTREFQIEGLFNPRNSKPSPQRAQKLLDNYLELLRILKFSKLWQQVKVAVDAGYTNVIYEGSNQMKNWKALQLTPEGKKVLGR